MTYRVAEKFVSINGEGERAGQCAVFIRLAGCPLRCSYCDTPYALSRECPYELMTAEEIGKYIASTGITNVTLTGGEPLWDKASVSLVRLLCEKGYYVELETSGCIDISPYLEISPAPVFTIDYKLPSSGMEDRMIGSNYSLLSSADTVKFVCGTEEDLRRALEIIETYELTSRCHVHMSPVFGWMEPQRIVEFMIKNRLNGVRLQMQIHKFIWSPDKRGV